MPNDFPAPALSADSARGEIKFVFNEKFNSVIELWLGLHAAKFHRAYPDRWVNSLYLDDIDLSALRTCVAGISQRAKVRYRWYGSVEGETGGQLEIKRKRNGLGWKQTFPDPKFSIRHGASWHSAVTEIRDHLPIEPSLWMDRHYRPIIIIRYSRQYFVSADGNFRITIDRHIQSFPQLNSPSANLRRAAAGKRPETIIEVKFGAESWPMASDIIEEFPIRRSRFSKYVEMAGDYINL